MALLTLYLLVGFIAAGYLLYANQEWQNWISGAAWYLVKPIVGRAIELINAPAFVYVISSLLLLAAAALSLAYWFRVVRPRIARFRALSFAIYGLPGPGGPESPMDAMRVLGATLRERELFTGAWAAFQTQVARDGAIPEIPFSYFAASDPAARDAEPRGLMQALPGYFTSIGLIFTFIGLVVALYFAARGFRSGDMEEARVSILQLLNAASFKFLTSVAALIGSLIISVFLRFSDSIMRGEAENSIARIESYVSVWRDVQVPGTATGPFSRVAAQFEAVIVGLGALTGRMDAIVERLQQDCRPNQAAE